MSRVGVPGGGSSASGGIGPTLTFLNKQRGYLPALVPAGLLLKLEVQGQPMPVVEVLDQGLQQLLVRLEITADALEPTTPTPGARADGWQVAAVMAMQVVVAIQRQRRLTIAASPRCRPLQSGAYLLYQPATDFDGNAVYQLVRLVFAALLEADPARWEAALLPQISRARGALQANLPGNVNTLLFLMAAHRLDVPVQMLETTLCRFGWGASSLLMDSSLTEKTSAIGCKVARNKMLAKVMLQSAGLPVAAGRLVETVADAWQAAQALTLPVVVKPLAADGGVEVHVRLERREEVEEAAAAVIAAGHRVLVEAWRPGRDYRLQVFQGAVFRCIERTPGGVVGDGCSTIATLLEALNRQSDRGPQGSGKPKRRIDLDLEAERTLARQGLARDSVPAAGCFVALRGAANVSRGGEMHEVLEQAHPDNLALAVEAAAALRLDLAGVDILMSDIRRSWLEVGAAICEVNAQPQMATHHAAVLAQQLQGDGRIPIDVIIGLDRLEPLLHPDGSPIASLSGPGLGLVCRAGVFVEGRCYSAAPLDQFEAISSLLGCRRVSRLVIVPWQDSLLADGLPIDRFDRLISLHPGSTVAVDAPSRTVAAGHALEAVLRQMAGACCVVNREHDLLSVMFPEDSGIIERQARRT